MFWPRFCLFFELPMRRIPSDSVAVRLRLRFAITLSKAAFMLGLPFGQNQQKKQVAKNMEILITAQGYPHHHFATGAAHTSSLALGSI